MLIVFFLKILFADWLLSNLELANFLNMTKIDDR